MDARLSPGSGEVTATLPIIHAPITHAQLGELLATLEFGVDPSDLHGSLTGYLCAGGHADARDWLAALRLENDEAEAAAAASTAPLQQLFHECSAWLDDPDLRFEPLLPSTDTPVDVRADALVEWCRGFLGGVGLAGMADAAGLSDDSAEILRDFSTIAASHFEYSDSEEDENALAEVIEFIRVGVLLLHTEFAATGTPAKATVH
jgi:yecA family protein